MATNSGKSNEEIEAESLKARGYNPAEIAGWLGNWDVESGFDPNSFNPGEGAIGISQWEGSRRAQGLDVYARQRGTSETDLQTQLGWNQAELASPYFASVQSQLQNVTDPGQAAAIIDSQYEISSGAARQTRIADAQKAYQQLQAGQPLTGGGNATTTTAMGGGSGGGVGFGSSVNAGFSIPGIPNLFGGLTGLDIFKPAISAVDTIGKLFKYMIWIFNPDNFIKLLLYLFGFAAVAAGLLMVIFATGKGSE